MKMNIDDMSTDTIAKYLEQRKREETRLKVGDWVEVLEGTAINKYRVGEIGEVVSVRSTGYEVDFKDSETNKRHGFSKSVVSEVKKINKPVWNDITEEIISEWRKFDGFVSLKHLDKVIGYIDNRGIKISTDNRKIYKVEIKNNDWRVLKLEVKDE